MPEFKISITVDEEGTFATLHNPPRRAMQIKTLLDLEIDKNGIRNVNQAAVARLATGTGSLRREKISDDNVNTAFDEEVRLEVTPDALSAYIVFKSPVNGGRQLTENEIRSFLDNKGVVYGINNALLNSVFKNRDYGQKYLLASGVPPIKGEDGYLQFFFDETGKNLKPLILENGNVDYHNIKSFEAAEKGQVLVKIFYGEKGTNGIDVYGKTINCHNGKTPQKIILGGNVVLSDDKTEIIAESDGQIIYQNRRLKVSPVIEINGSVGPSTGNIEFKGTVKVYGDLMNDYSITAEGNVELAGTADGNFIDADGSVLIAGGIPGMNRFRLNAGGTVSAKYISNSEVSAGADLYTDSILHSVIKTNGRIELNGKKSMVSGGKIFARKSVIAKSIGSNMATATEVYAGLDYEVYDKYLASMAEYKELLAKREEVIKSIAYLVKVSQSEGLSEEKRKNLKILKYNEINLKKHLLKLKEQISSILKVLESDMEGAYVKADIIYPGVRIQIGNAVMLVKDEIYNSRFMNKGNNIIVRPVH
ncbi:FapA family protein [Tyzzerella sp. OttesenSCG-928-J15]|nr:FapA family protein [Tyzzerella sp. OttesenSCG-928-J15]